MADVGRVANPAHRRRFAAFISYSHADAAYAGKLQSRLERYRLPKHIAAAHAEGQAALGQIFRDREDLAAAPSLSDAIRAAIGEAEALIVICSPDARASHWVGEEIALFRSLHPDRPILAALIRGEPEQSFPAALTKDGNEPLAADLRKEADGQTLGFLKIVAGIAGVPLDALVQRDAQRRVRRVMWITGAALAAMLVMGVMTTLAVQARNEAARQRAEAEGLVEYMLTDLRDKLKGVGRLDVMSAVNARAMKYYGKQGGLESLSPQSLNRRARILHAMGEDDEKRGNLNLALAKFKEAHRATAAVLAQKPDDPAAIFDHSQSEYWVAYGAFLNNQIPESVLGARRYGHYAEQLLALDPENPKYRMEIGWVDNLRAVISLYGLKDSKAAEQQVLRFQAQFNNIAKSMPDDFDVLTSQSIAHSLLGEIYLAQNRNNEALEQRLKERDILRRLFNADPGHADNWRFGMIRSRDIAKLLLEKKDYRGADWYLKQAENMANQLERLDQTNSDWKLQRVMTMIARYHFLVQKGADKEKIKMRESLKIIRTDNPFINQFRAQDRVFIKKELSKI